MQSAAQKRKGRWSYARPTTKRLNFGDVTMGITLKRTASGRMDILRRSGTKMLSIFGLGSNSGSNSTTPSEKERAVTPISPASAPYRMPFDVVLDSPTIDRSGEVTEPKIVPFEVVFDLEVSRLRHRRSVPGINRRLSNKFSMTFGNTTVVHRPKLRAKPSIHPIAEYSKTIIQIDGVPFSDNGTNPSSILDHSGSRSLAETSTAETSLESNIGALKTAISKSRSDNGTTQGTLAAVVEGEIRDTTLAPIQELPIVVQPTVKTVETTANAKIFFETHFNTILSGQDTPRSRRRQALEIALRGLSQNQRGRERAAWAEQETAYLRQYRVLKGQSTHMTGSKGVSIAGYEVVRILGKGSFGVVRLVREKSAHVGTLPPEHGIPPDPAQPPQEEHAKVRMSAMETFKATAFHRAHRSHLQATDGKQEVYAMKVIRKSEMLRNSQEGHLRAERDFLVAASEKSSWIVPLIASFQDNTNLYLVMEYMIGGDFLGLLIRKEQLKEPKTQWYIAEMILCIEEAHRLHWIHRDVKPDNFLISASGHLKISDFGLAFDGHWAHDQSYYNYHRYHLLEKLGIGIEGDAIDKAESCRATASKKLAHVLARGKEGQGRDRTGNDRHQKPHVEEHGHEEGILQWRNRHGRRKLAKSVVGTSQYMAPEIIRGDRYDGRCDWWSLAIIMFECLYGRTPFVDEDRQKTKMKILQHKDEFYFPSSKSTAKQYKVSETAKDLMGKILQEKELRLCSQKYLQNDVEILEQKHSPDTQDFEGNFVYPNDAAEIKAHPFFDGIPWHRLHLTKPPWVPSVKSPSDAHWFDEEDGPISDVDDASSTSTIQEHQLAAQEAYEEGIAAAYARRQEAAAAAAATAAAGPASVPDMKAVDSLLQAEHTKLRDAEGAVGVGRGGPAGGGRRAAKDWKRPRDRLLRDRNVARQVLEIRKRGAFLGYAYRRPAEFVVGGVEN